MIVLCIFDDVWLLNLFRCETNTLYCILNRNLVITRLILYVKNTHTMMTRFTSFFSKIQYTNNCKTIIKISSNDNWSTLVMANKNFLLQGNSTYHSGPDDATNCQQQIKKTRRLAQKREKLANQLSFKLQQPRPLLTWAVVHSWVQ